MECEKNKSKQPVENACQNRGPKNRLCSKLADFFKIPYRNGLNLYLAFRRRPYIGEIKNYIANDTSIISSNCFAGRVMQDLKMQYNSPTLGLYFWAPDYIEFLRHLKFYLTEARITFVKHSKYPLGDERHGTWKHWYPIGLLDNKVEIHFLHYHSEEEAAEKWYRRASRVNFNKLLILGMEQNLCTEKEIREFDTLQFVDKYFFSSKNIPLSSNIFMKEFEKMGEVGDPYKKGHLFYRELVERLKNK